jgi:CSLREA domain-containing protein
VIKLSRPSTTAVTLAAFFALTASAHANELLVNSSADSAPAADASCTLREAVNVANGLALSPECGTGSANPADLDTIRFTPAVTAIDLGGPSGQNTQLSLTTNINIVGPGVTVTNSSPASATGRIFQIAVGDAVTISGLQITGGDVAGSPNAVGGGIHNSGTLTLTDVRVAGNTVTATSSGAIGPNAVGAGIYGEQAGSLALDRVVVEDNEVKATSASGTDNGGLAYGGGIASEGPLTLDRTTVDGNEAVLENSAGTGSYLAYGGGIGQGVLSAVTARRSTVSRNSARATSSTPANMTAEGGGISIITSPAPEHRVELSTISGNTITASAVGATPILRGGGIATGVNNPVTVVGSTIADNGPDPAAPLSGANVSGAGAVDFLNTIIADPRGGPTSENCDATAGSDGFNLDEDGSCDLTSLSQTDQVGDPGLGPLTGNGGLTETMLPSSPAVIDQGEDDETVGGDQRELTRPVDLPGAPNGQGDNADIGAVEIQLPVVTPPGTTPSGASAGTVPGPTGQRAAALKKCKKVKSKKKRKKCRKRAQQLPL